METYTYTTDSIEAWYNYYDALEKAGPYHNPTYLSLLEGNFEFEDERAEMFVLEDGDRFVYYPYLVRSLESVEIDDPSVDLSSHRDIVSSWYYGGPLASTDDDDLAVAFIERFSEHCCATNIVAEFVRFDPNVENYETFEGLSPEFNRKTVPVDLTQTTDGIWDGYSSSNRTHIRRARDAGIAAAPTTELEDIEAFYEIYCSAMDAKGASDHYRFSFEFFRGFIVDHVDLCTLVAARYEDEVIGASMLMHDRVVGNEYLRASDPDFWDLGLNNFLCHRAVLAMHSAGYDLLDFQGGRPGVFDFKKAFSPDRGEFYIARRVHMPDIYDTLVEDAEAEGMDTNTDYFPAYRLARSN